MIMIRFIAVPLFLLLSHIPGTALAHFVVGIPVANISKQKKNGGELGAVLRIYMDELK